MKHGRVILGVVIAGAVASGCSTGRDAGRDRITRILDRQAAAWNRGDVDEFMRYYRRGDDLTFSSGGTTRRGWQATLDRYRTTYPTPEAMGKLTFSGLEFTPLGPDHMLVLGSWHLDRGEDAVGGNFTLVLAYRDGDWCIVHDHTSRMTPESEPAP